MSTSAMMGYRVFDRSQEWGVTGRRGRDEGMYEVSQCEAKYPFEMDGGLELVVVEAIELATNDKKHRILWMYRMG
jgi:hypothetical protein